MRKFVIATKNSGKLKEIEEILEGMNFEVVSMEEVGVTQDIEESGSTFEENALIKAREVYKACGEMVMADDSGLEVDYLDGAPGIYSSRFAGEGASDADRNNKLLSLLKDVPFEKRKARFVCVIAVILSNEEYFTVRGTVEGYIGFEPRGNNGFGYDPLFFVPEYNMTSAQMEPSKKHEISHRGKAIRMMLEELKKRLDV
ncbi:XTP/dITP diphosphatase [Acetivibrio mesophilus]|uniref:dITP/XTP pyrophosphatase n=1 Tax=Acetivibrio mesophilus TaxID=2487273 RepID=A0A4Q0I1Y7_9FIRM|nr:XTP/dITP diphosphatase [Acetivibrio mesophilus]ODM25972.1 non-canonical purine NTP pyrophosphatase, RdgB/HAM1 family [Clostridium sp. Bc-iso-3]RXE58193.1 XTP/dITP diphosphatase [Acetivibrio mesophilus]HHV29248.1 XTP/dITP diphosphatase [Clostridium sp.]